MSPARRTLPGSALALALTVVVVSVVVLGLELGSQDARTAYTDLVQLLAAGVAAVTAGGRASRCTGRARLSWAALSAGCGGWALGEAVWTWYELALGVETPFPSWADVGFLCFPVGAAAALVLRPSPGTGGDLRRRWLDATMAAAALALVSWQTVLGAVLSAGGTPLELAVSLAYPLTDALLLALIVLTLSRSRARTALWLTAGGIASLSLSDSAFAYLAATDSYVAGVVDIGWIGAFVLLALAPLAHESRDDDLGRTDARSALRLYPYIPVAVAGLVVVGRKLAGNPPTTGQLALGGGLITLLMLRQYLTLRENAVLTLQLAEREAQLRHLAFHDPLTGLANRALFHDRLAHALELHARDLRPVALIFLDLDDFKMVNDGQGHAAGDELLIRVAERLSTTLRLGDTIARLGGDEFAVLLEDASDAGEIAAALAVSLGAAFALQGSSVQVGASIGLVNLAGDAPATFADDLLAKADTAMYAAKRGGKGRVEIFEDGMSLAELDDQRMAAALRDAIRRGELELAYQPIIDLVTGSIHSVEALARWRWEDRQIGPDVFVAVAERSGLMEALTRWVLDEGCGQLASWTAARPADDFRLCVNVSPSQICDDAFRGTVRAALRKHGVPPQRLTLEITETALLCEAATATSVVGELRAMGVHIALDDFGVGESTLGQLHAIDLDVVKIDKSMIDRLDSDPRQVRLLRALLRIGHDLGVQIVAEGIERQAQLDVLCSMGAEQAQGFLLARPMPPANLLALLHVPVQRPLLAVEATGS